MPLPRHDEQPLPSRRALRQAERELAAASSGAPRPAAARRVVPPTAVVSGSVLPDHVLEGGDDVWVEGVTPRPTPVGSRAVEVAPAAPVRTVSHTGAWRRLPQVMVVASLVAATVGYAVVDDTTATAGSVPEFVREETVVTADEPTVVAAGVPEAAPSELVAGDDGLLRVREGEGEASRSDRAVLPGCDGVPPEGEVANGRMDEGYLCTLWDGRTRIRADAAVSLTLLNEAYLAEFGTDICMTDGYRSYAAQVTLRNQKPRLAARPGTSEHGYGLAVDMCGGVETEGPGYWWLRENAAVFGWENPAWAQKGGGGPYEPWHWEYTAGQW